VHVVSAKEPVAEDVLHMLKERGFRMTPQRRVIVAEVMRTKRHIDPSSLISRIQRQVPDVNASTVYRTLWLLDELGVLTHSHFEDGVQYHRAQQADHVHLTCAACGSEQSLEQAEVEPFRELISDRYGFAADFTHFAISGLCRRCRRKSGPERGEHR
jgi:Fur family ferric uptake transcriptional regulator